VVQHTTSSGAGTVTGAHITQTTAFTFSASVSANNSLLLWGFMANPTTYTAGGNAATNNTVLFTNGASMVDASYDGRYTGAVNAGSYTVGSSDTCGIDPYCYGIAIEIKEGP